MRHSMAWPRSTTSSWVTDSGSPGGDTDLLAHDVDPGHGLGDGVLDLHARVHLEEVVRTVDVEQALDRSRGSIADRASGVDRDRPDARAELVVHGGRRRLLDELLMPPLDRAVALAEVNDVAVGVGEDLDLDVPRILEVALDVDGRVGEVRLALAPGALEGTLDLVGGASDAHPLPPPPADAFTTIG